MHHLLYTSVAFDFCIKTEKVDEMSSVSKPETPAHSFLKPWKRNGNRTLNFISEGRHWESATTPWLSAGVTLSEQILSSLVFISKIPSGHKTISKYIKFHTHY